MSNPLAKYFPSISSKQWKQKIQYLLQGKNYQDLIVTDIDNISTLPFYTHEEGVTDFTFINKTTATSKPAYYHLVRKAEEANHSALEAQKNGIPCIYFALFDPQIDLDILLKNLTIKVIIQCYFLNIDFSKHPALKNKNNCELIFDCLGKISKTGNWYTSAKNDFSILKQSISKQHTICINLSNFHNAGASAVQQLSYGISQLITYASNNIINKQHTVTYLLSVNTDIYLEVAKIKTLRILHKQVASSLNLNENCTLIQQKSKRNLSGLLNEINTVDAATERHIAQLGAVDFFTSTPRNFSFYKEDIPEDAQLFNDLKSSALNFTNYTEGVIYIEKITSQLLDKSTKLIETLEKGGGFIEQLKKGTLQQKISKNEMEQTKNFTAKTNTDIYNTFSFCNKTPLSYPFLKFKKRKTLWQPIIEKQWRSATELPYWKENFEQSNA